MGQDTLLAGFSSDIAETPNKAEDLKILHLIDSGGMYGAEAVLLTLMEQQNRMGCVPVLGSIGAPGESEKPLEAEARRRGLSVRPFRMGSVPGPGGIREILQTIRKEGVHIVHTHGYKSDILFGLLPRGVRPVPVVATLHGWCSAERFSKLRLYEWLDARALAFLDGVAVVSARMLDQPGLVGRMLPILRVIPNCIPSPPDVADSCHRDALNDFCGRRFTFGSFGRLSPEKDYTTLVEALALLRHRGLDAQLLIAGEGDERGQLIELIQKRGLCGRVLLPGYLPGARQYLPRIGAYVQSSITEGMPVSILEALAAGVPIVATSVGGVPDMLDNGRAGVLVPPHDTEGLANAMERVLLDPNERQRLSLAARQLSADRHSAERMAKDYARLYGEVLGTRRGTGGRKG